MDPLRHKLVRIRKEHQCFGCYRVFSPPSMMFSWAAAYEGTVGSGYTCTTCNELMKHCEDNGNIGFYDEGFALDEMEYNRVSKTPISSPEELLELLKNKKNSVKDNE